MFTTMTHHFFILTAKIREKATTVIFKTLCLLHLRIIWRVQLPHGYLQVEKAGSSQIIQLVKIETGTDLIFLQTLAMKCKVKSLERVGIYECHQFLRISYWSNSEHWSQKRTQSGNIHSTKLDVYAVKQSALNISLIISQHKQGRKYYALSSSPLTICQNW